MHPYEIDYITQWNNEFNEKVGDDKMIRNYFCMAVNKKEAKKFFNEWIKSHNYKNLSVEIKSINKY